MSRYKIMKVINSLINKNISHLNLDDCEHLFEFCDIRDLQEDLEYVGCKVCRVSDLFNVTLPEEKFTRKELANQRQYEEFVRKYC